MEREQSEPYQQQPYATQQALRQQAATGIDVTSELQQLVDLKTQGLLSDNEFTAAKKQLLGG